MKQKQICGLKRPRLLMPSVKTLLAGLFTCALTVPGYSQYVQNYEFDTDMKHYSTEVVPGATDEVVMAGTFYDFNSNIGKNVVHFLHLDNSGAITDSKYFDFNDYTDERAVDIATNGNGNFYITALGRQETTGGNDRILILDIDVNGILNNSYYIRSTTPGTSLYPLHSIYVASNNSLYICGYQTLNRTVYPWEPTYAGYDQKRGFVISYDLTAQAVANTFWVNHAFTNAGSATDDYDIAMRLIERQDGQIFLTGSVNSVALTGGGKDEYHSATMNIGLNLALTNPPQWDNPFAAGTGDNVWSDEYGVGMYEGENGLGKYIVSNRFFRNNGTVDFANTIPAFVDITWVSPPTSLPPTSSDWAPDISGNLTRFMFRGYDYAWGLQTMKAFNDPLSPAFPTYGDARIIIAGMETNDFCATSTSFFDNVRPFLFDVELGHDGTNIIATPWYWTHYWNQVGTGSYSMDPNSYAWLGGGISNWAWNPTFAARDDDNVFFSAPRWNPSGTNKLNLKSIMTDASDYTTINCSTGYHQEVQYTGCISGTNSFARWPVGNTGYPANPIIKTYGTITTASNSTNVTTGDHAEDATVTCDNTNPAYKASGIEKQKNSHKTLIYPNPANRELFISLPVSIASGTAVRIELVNLFGQVASTLYEGAAGQLVSNHAISLPEVPTGIYLVKINAGDVLLHQQQIHIIK